MRKPIAVAFAFLLVISGTTFASSSNNLTPDQLFARMEKQTEKINSLVANLKVESSPEPDFVTLYLKDPDKFAIIFKNNFATVTFDGQILWIYIDHLKEAFFLDTRFSDGWFSKSLREWINPKMVVANVTRQTIFTFFEITMKEQTRVKSPDTGKTINYFKLSFVPKAADVMTRVFQVGHYEMLFSDDVYLPTKVWEYGPDGKMRGYLEVSSYLINSEISDDVFRFSLPEGATVLPMSVVIGQKLEETRDYAKDRLGSFFEGLKQKMLDWGL